MINNYARISITAVTILTIIVDSVNIHMRLVLTLHSFIVHIV